MATQWIEDIQAAFPGDADLTTRIIGAANKYQGELPAIFGDIAKHVLATSPSAQPANSKKRKLNDASQPTQVVTNGAGKPTGISNPVVAFECKNVSFAVPVRKKLKLQIIADQADSRKREVRLLNAQTNETEFSLPNTQIDQVFCFPVPEKQQRQSNFVVLPQSGATAPDGTPYEQMVFTLNETKPDDANSANRPKAEGDTYVTVTEPELNALVQPFGKHVIRPTDAEFASSIPQPHRKGEKGYHVKAHRGTKEGYLFFLPTGIIFGFKKPLAYFPFSAIESISYTSVLQRTFNLVVTATEGGSTEPKDVEFSMLDQADFAGIDEYIKRHELNDASMAATRRAKEYNVNKEAKKAEANGDAGGAAGGAHTAEDDGMTELQRAEQQLQDEEDEEEEDYEASGGESDGEGEDSDEDEEEYGDGEGEEYDEDEGEDDGDAQE